MYMLPVIVFKEYDIRGKYPEEINPQFAYILGIALLKIFAPNRLGCILIAHDSREGGQELAKALYHALKTKVPEIKIKFLGMQHSGGLSVLNLSIDGALAIYITASHNPLGYHGFKIYIDRLPFNSELINIVKVSALSLIGADASAYKFDAENFAEPPIERLDNSYYIDAILAEPFLEQPKYKFRVAVDGGNGVGGIIASELYRKMGHEVLELNCEPDGSFPNHHPDPSIPENMVQLQNFVRENNCDIGLAFDGDADRLGVVDYRGEIVDPDRVFIFFIRQMMKYHLSHEMLPKGEKVKIAYDLKSSRHIEKEILKAGALPLICKTGHSNMTWDIHHKDGVLFGAEYSGHYYFFKDGYVLNDGVYSGYKLLRFLSLAGREAFDNLPQDESIPELRIPYSHEHITEFLAFAKDEATALLKPKQIIEIDGIRIETEHGFLLIRPSKTEEVLSIRAEADSKEHLEALLDFVHAKIAEFG